MASQLTRLKARLHKEGRWKEFLLLRESIKPTIIDNGLQIKHANRLASFAFQPLDGSPHEFERNPWFEKFLPLVGIDPDAHLVVKLPNEPIVHPDGETEFFLDGEQWTDPPADQVTIEPPPLPKLENSDNWIKYDRGIRKVATAMAASAADKRQAFEQLFEAVDRKKRCKPYDMVQWVFEYAGINPAAITPEEVPSAGALKYLQLCQENPSAYAEFMKSLYSKTIPDKRQLEHEARQRDDGQTQLRLLDSFDEQFASEHVA